MKKILSFIIVVALFACSSKKEEVENSVQSVTLSNTSLNLVRGEKTQLYATVNPQTTTRRIITWETSNKSVATVSNNGEVQAVDVGTCIISVSCEDKKSECYVIVTYGSVPVLGINLDKTSETMSVGNTLQLKAIIFPENATDKTVFWSSSVPEIATVQNGIVTAIKPGEAKIKAEAGNKSATCNIRVMAIPAESIEINRQEIMLKEGGSVHLEATIKPDNATDKTIVWSSSDISVATIDNNGEVTAVKKGITSITAKVGDIKADCKIIVVPVPEAVDLGLSVKWASFNLGASRPEECGHYYAWGETETQYSSKDPLTWKENKGYWFDSYKWWGGMKNGYYTFTKYCPDNKQEYWAETGIPDGKTVLDLEDDVAHVVLGDQWRMPTYEELEELFTLCTWTTENADGDKVIAPNGNSIFLPTTGLMQTFAFNYANRDGYYWSSSILSDSPSAAQCLYFWAGATDYMGNCLRSLTAISRCFGYPIRPVTE